MRGRPTRSIIARVLVALGLFASTLGADMSGVLRGLPATPSADAINPCDLQPDPKPDACLQGGDQHLDSIELAGWSTDRGMIDNWPLPVIADPYQTVRAIAYTDVTTVFPTISVTGPCGFQNVTPYDFEGATLFDIRFDDIGECVVTATATQGATTLSRTDTILGYRIPQSLTWATTFDTYYQPGERIEVAALSSAGFPGQSYGGIDPGYAVDGPCAISGSKCCDRPLIIYVTTQQTESGICTITATAGGNGVYLPAPPISTSFIVATVAPDLSWAGAGPPTSMEFPHAGTYEISAISWTSVLGLSASGACTLVSNGIRQVSFRYFEITGSVTTTGAGTCTLNASVTQFVLDMVKNRSVSPMTISREVPVVANEPPPPPNAPPVAAFSVDQPSTSAPSAVTFDASSSTDDSSIATYAWDFGNGQAATGPAAATTYARTGTYTVALTVTDDEGLSTTITHDVTVVDTTTPIVSATVTGPQGDNGWYTGDVGVTWTVTDDESDVATETGCAPTTVATDTAAVTLTCEATSGGGTTSQSVTFKRDATAPTLSPVVTPNPVVVGAAVSATANAGDALSGLATSGCGTVTSASVGSGTVTCSATDAAGNSASATAAYQVNWAWRGFQGFRPLPAMSRVVAGRPVPLAFSLGGNFGLEIIGGSPTSQQVNCATGTPIGQPTNVDPRSALYYVAPLATYLYTWRTDRAWRRTCRVFTLQLIDGTVHSVGFRFV